MGNKQAVQFSPGKLTKQDFSYQQVRSEAPMCCHDDQGAVLHSGGLYTCAISFLYHQNASVFVAFANGVICYVLDTVARIAC